MELRIKNEVYNGSSCPCEWYNSGNLWIYKKIDYNNGALHSSVSTYTTIYY